ncbi:unnamed protein product [Ambrosiozyma monospora]|uniref:Unnamed protein product n=1 Tax=Ambrosiozyma monospora TaxID=43982 RepID=A0ACB5T9F3_AMBMO|nr:unnamed protein product [Ambrosiozyma monospora]
MAKKNRKRWKKRKTKQAKTKHNKTKLIQVTTTTPYTKSSTEPQFQIPVMKTTIPTLTSNINTLSLSGSSTSDKGVHAINETNSSNNKFQVSSSSTSDSDNIDDENLKKQKPKNTADDEKSKKQKKRAKHIKARLKAHESGNFKSRGRTYIHYDDISTDDSSRVTVMIMMMMKSVTMRLGKGTMRMIVKAILLGSITMNRLLLKPTKESLCIIRYDDDLLNSSDDSVEWDETELTYNYYTCRWPVNLNIENLNLKL